MMLWCIISSCSISLRESMPDCRENTYYLHLEALNTLLILLGCQMYTAKPAHELPVYRWAGEDHWTSNVIGLLCLDWCGGGLIAHGDSEMFQFDMYFVNHASSNVSPISGQFLSSFKH